MNHEPALEPSRKLTIPVNIKNGDTVSESVDMTNFALTAIVIPSTFTGVALTFSAALPSSKDKDKADYFPMTDSAGAAVSVTVATGRFVALAPAIGELFKGVQYLKVISGGAEGGNRTIYLVGTVKF